MYICIFGQEQHLPAHLALQPFGKVPVLVNGDRVLFESKAITKYIDRAFKGKKLTPKDAWGQYQMENWMSAYDAYFSPKQHIIYFEMILKKR